MSLTSAHHRSHRSASCRFPDVQKLSAPQTQLCRPPIAEALWGGKGTTLRLGCTSLRTERVPPEHPWRLGAASKAVSTFPLHLESMKLENCHSGTRRISCTRCIGGAWPGHCAELLHHHWKCHKYVASKAAKLPLQTFSKHEDAPDQIKMSQEVTYKDRTFCRFCLLAAVLQRIHLCPAQSGTHNQQKKVKPII